MSSTIGDLAAWTQNRQCRKKNISHGEWANSGGASSSSGHTSHATTQRRLNIITTGTKCRAARRSHGANLSPYVWRRERSRLHRKNGVLTLEQATRLRTDARRERHWNRRHAHGSECAASKLTSGFDRLSEHTLRRTGRVFQTTGAIPSRHHFRAVPWREYSRACHRRQRGGDEVLIRPLGFSDRGERRGGPVYLSPEITVRPTM